MRPFHLYLISDSTGETLGVIARAVWARFNLSEPVEHIYALTRTQKQIEDAIDHIKKEHSQITKPALVMCTLVDNQLRDFLQKQCANINVPCIAVLDQIAATLGNHLGITVAKRPPGGQHMMDNAYFDRLKALAFALSHDDGQQAETLDDADVILLGLSRTSKTPTCFYLAHRGIKAANIPIVPNMTLPDSLKKLTKPLIIGLLLKPLRLVQLRKQRFAQNLQNHPSAENNAYTDSALVAKEVAHANQIFSEAQYPVIDVTQRSVEETAAFILNLKREHDEKINA